MNRKNDVTYITGYQRIFKKIKSKENGLTSKKIIYKNCFCYRCKQKLYKALK